MLLVEKPLDGVAVVTLNRPEAMNALSKALRAALQTAMLELDALKQELRPRTLAALATPAAAR